MHRHYTVTVSIPNPPLALERTLRFDTNRARQAFILIAKDRGYTILGQGTDVVFSDSFEAIDECLIDEDRL